MPRVLIVLLVLAAPPAVTISLNPSVLFAGGTLRVRCTVPPHVENRWLDIVVMGYTGSGRQLDGERAPITWEQIVEHVPCGAGPVFCEVTRANGDSFRAIATLIVAGCEAARR